MQNSLGTRCVIILLAGILLQTGGRLRAEEPKEEFLRFKATEKNGKEKIYDLGMESDAKELAEKVSKGEIQRLEVEEQPNILALRWDLGLWTLVVFVVLFLVLKKLAWKPMLEGLQKRENNIRSAV